MSDNDKLNAQSRERKAHRRAALADRIKEFDQATAIYALGLFCGELFRAEISGTLTDPSDSLDAIAAKFGIERKVVV